MRQASKPHVSRSVFHFFVFFSIYFVFGIFLGSHSLTYPWFIDDLHQVRVFSLREILASWVGPFDPSGFETAGYRPILVLFNHFRAVLCGESVVAHRIFGIALFAAYLAVFLQIGRLSGLKLKQLILAGFLVLAAKNSWSHLVWILGAVRTFSGLLGALSCLMLLGSQGRKKKIIASIFIFGAAVLTREDLVAWAVFPILYHGYLESISSVDKNKDAVNQKKGSFLHLTVLVPVAAILLGLRGVFVPQADWRFEPGGWKILFETCFYPMGQTISYSFRFLWRVILLAVTLVALINHPPQVKRRCVLWLLGCFLFTSMGLVNARVDNLLVATSFFALFWVDLIQALENLGAFGKFFSWTLTAGLILVSAWRNTQAQETMHPLSLDTLPLAAEFAFTEGLDIPSQRLEALRERFLNLGITNAEEADLKLTAYRALAIRNRRFHPGTTRQPFLPKIGFHDY